MNLFYPRSITAEHDLDNNLREWSNDARIHAQIFFYSGNELSNDGLSMLIVFSCGGFDLFTRVVSIGLSYHGLAALPLLRRIVCRSSQTYLMENRQNWSIRRVPSRTC